MSGLFNDSPFERKKSHGLIYGFTICLHNLVHSNDPDSLILICFEISYFGLNSYVLQIGFRFPSIAWSAVIFGASVGGIGSGLLWTAQGVYFKVTFLMCGIPSSGLNFDNIDYSD